jgi:hypothetical protein
MNAGPVHSPQNDESNMDRYWILDISFQEIWHPMKKSDPEL